MESILSFIGGFHLYVLGLTALVILYSDHQGFAYFRGTKQTLSPVFIHWAHILVWVGLTGMIVTGAALLIPQWEFMLQRPEFFVKMGFVGVLIVNAFAIRKLSRIAAERPFTLLTREERQSLMISGVLSTVGWVGAAFIGYFIL